MNYKKIPFKTYCWCIGTTSFRTDKLNLKIEKQLNLLEEFRELELKENKIWNWDKILQEKYYNYLHKNQFLIGEAKRKGKDAREKSSGLVDIGLLNKNREFTEVGYDLLNISKQGDFSVNNDYNLPADSYIYFKQLLKTYIKVGKKGIRPFVIFSYLVSKFEYLTQDEFSYLLPLCVDFNSTKNICSSIDEVRKGTKIIDDIIIENLLLMDNYKAALSLFLEEEVNEELVCIIGMNRKSRSYDKVYYELYQYIENFVLEKNVGMIFQIYEATRKIKGKAGVLWRNYIFNTTSVKKIEKAPLEALKENLLFKSETKKELKVLFFKFLHLFKAKSTLLDYFDLNRRYFKLTDAVLFEEGIVKFDIVIKYFFEKITDDLLDIAFVESDLLYKNCTIEEISPKLHYEIEALFDGINRDYSVHVTSISQALNIIKNEKYKRFNNLIDMKFDDKTLIKLLDMFEKREDSKIFELVTDNAEIPTIFEYIIGIIWYKISNRQGDILEYMNLSLEADLLPKTHASGGEADIVYYYPKTKDYPEHYLLLEATLSESSKQRRMEMEPVSRHLGEYILKTRNETSYCVFITTNLHRNVISDFRHRKNYEYYSIDYTECVKGLKIIPLQTSTLKEVIKLEKKYPEIYNILEKIYESKEPIPTWYSKLERKLLK